MFELILIVFVFLLSAIYLRRYWKSRELPPGPLELPLLGYLRRYWKFRGLPPGPLGLPLLGYVPFLGSNPLKTYDELAKKYGEMFTLQLGRENIIFLNSREIINEVFAKNRKTTSDRPPNFLLNFLTNGLSISFTNGPVWKCHREFAIKSLKTFGVEAMEQRVLEEVEFLCKALEEKRGETFECQKIFSKAVTNVVWNVIMSSRHSYDDENFSKVASVVTRGSATASDNFQTLLITPFLRHFPYYNNAFKELISSFQFVKDEIEKAVDEHVATVDESCPRDYADDFLLEMKKEEDPSFTKQKLIVNIVGFLSAGTETTTHTLRWSVLALAANPQCQKRIFQEICEVIGSDEVSYKHKDEMHFTNAFLHEVFRYRPPSPLGVPHVTSQELVLRGYRIPPKVQLFSNFWSLHHNPKLFQDPNEFRPERFLDESGYFTPSPNVIPFALGSRRCYGEPLARIELFIFLTRIVQNFEIICDKTKGSRMFEDGVLSISYAPKESTVEFRKRTPGYEN